ncbi:MAG: EAL domain-containing protein [Epsilonproteobacteria bacterium]|nr:EAL domain-containing protein [Campylobacterota bacterium]
MEDYKSLSIFQNETLDCLQKNIKILSKLDEICFVLKKNISTSEFKIIDNELKYDKKILKNDTYAAMVTYAEKLIKLLQKDQEKEKNLFHLAYHDTLTDLKNKNSLQKTLKTDIRKYTLLLLNVDNFSYVNTAYGCDSGDIILKKIADMLRDICQHDLLYRINADEFGIVYRGEIDVIALIKKLQKYFFKKAIVVDNLTFHVTFTYGATTGKYTLFKKATVALKEAKEKGNNRHKVYYENEKIIEECQLTQFVNWNHIVFDALQNSKVVPFFQGIYDNKLKKITHYETLARIKHKNGYYTPYHFLETTKLSGMLPMLTKIMIKKSFEVMSNNKFDFSINITEQDLEQGYLVQFLNKSSKKYDIEPNRICLEILEGISSQDSKNHIKQLRRIKKYGYKIAIDDFGTEYSNFERLIDLDIDYLKLDAKYIKNIDKNKKSQDIVNSIVFFAKKNNIPCIAEFVHNKEVAKQVASMDIEYSQGYFFSKPNRIL